MNILNSIFHHVIPPKNAILVNDHSWDYLCLINENFDGNPIRVFSSQISFSIAANISEVSLLRDSYSEMFIILNLPHGGISILNQVRTSAK